MHSVHMDFTSTPIQRQLPRKLTGTLGFASSSTSSFISSSSYHIISSFLYSSFSFSCFFFFFLFFSSYARSSNYQFGFTLTGIAHSHEESHTTNRDSGIHRCFALTEKQLRYSVENLAKSGISPTSPALDSSGNASAGDPRPGQCSRSADSAYQSMTRYVQLDDVVQLF